MASTVTLLRASDSSVQHLDLAVSCMVALTLGSAIIASNAFCFSEKVKDELDGNSTDTQCKVKVEKIVSFIPYSCFLFGAELVVRGGEYSLSIEINLTSQMHQMKD